jgi:hypothetical protein
VIQDPTVDLWFCDETSFWGDPKPYLVWAKRGSKPTVPFTGNHFRTCVIGAVCPQDGRFTALMVTTGNQDLFQVFLDHLNQAITPGRRSILILDNVSFHKTQSLRWGNIEPRYLPTYSPELNPIEELWLLIKTTHFYLRLANSQDHLEDMVAEALAPYFDLPKQIMSTCSMAAYL